MKNDVMLNMGLNALLPEMSCLRAEFSSPCLPPEVRTAGRVIIAVDNRKLFLEEWIVFNALQVLRPDATTVCLTREETGRVFPAGSRIERIVH